jgi:MSHA biogenesis protein MshK
MAQRLIGALCALAAALAASASEAALAQALADPMRPPAAPAASPAEGAKDSPPAMRLQSVLISAARRVAVIDGRLVRQGERVGDGKLVAISESHVVLQRPHGRETLKLNATVDKQPVPRRAVKAVP